jgi:hypothetical protein
MHHHGPDELLGPLRGTTAWWRGMEPAPELSPEGPHDEPETRGETLQPMTSDDGIRADKVARARQALAAGHYDRPEIWERTLDRLLDRLDED